MSSCFCLNHKVRSCLLYMFTCVFLVQMSFWLKTSCHSSKLAQLFTRVQTKLLFLLFDPLLKPVCRNIHLSVLRKEGMVYSSCTPILPLIYFDLNCAASLCVLHFSLTCFCCYSTCLHKLSAQRGVIKPLKWRIATEHMNLSQKKSTKIHSSNL